MKLYCCFLVLLMSVGIWSLPVKKVEAPSCRSLLSCVANPKYRPCELCTQSCVHKGHICCCLAEVDESGESKKETKPAGKVRPRPETMPERPAQPDLAIERPVPVNLPEVDLTIERPVPVLRPEVDESGELKKDTKPAEKVRPRPETMPERPAQPDLAIERPVPVNLPEVDLTIERPVPVLRPEVDESGELKKETKPAEKVRPRPETMPARPPQPDLAIEKPVPVLRPEVDESGKPAGKEHPRPELISEDDKTKDKPKKDEKPVPELFDSIVDGSGEDNGDGSIDGEEDDTACQLKWIPARWCKYFKKIWDHIRSKLEGLKDQ